MEEIVISESEYGQRLDKYLTKYYKNIPYGRLQKMIRNKDVKVNGRRAQADRRLVAGDRISVYLYDNEKKEEARRTAYALDETRIVYEDRDMLIYDKAAGESAQGGTDVKCDLSAAFASYLEHKGEYAPEVQRTYTPSFINRLDTNTMGLMVGAKNYFTAKKLSRLSNEGKIKKYYTALLCGKTLKPGVYRAYLHKDERTKTAHIYANERLGAKEIITEIISVKSNDNKHLCRILLKTGRYHQIRAHMAFLSCPVVGDKKYGNAAVNAAFKRRYDVDSQLLKADEVVVIGEEPLRFKVDCPLVFEKAFSGRQ